MLTIAQQFFDEMILHARAEDPNECCGIIAGQGESTVRLYRVTNTAKSPYRYAMDSKELLRAYREIEDNNWEILVLYHSHTHTAAFPSDTDVRLATWPDAYYALVSLVDKEHPVVRVFTIVDGRVNEQPFRVV